MATTGEVAYEAYRKRGSGKSPETGLEIAPYSQTSTAVKEVWQAVADAVSATAKDAGAKESTAKDPKDK